LKSLGISITRDSLSAFLWEQSLTSSRIEGACAVTCGEPYGGPDDIARLAEEVRKIAGPGKIPSAVISLPPSWTFVRRISLPVTDLPRAKKMHIAELEGNLPIEDEEILSDILPSPAGETGTFLAIAAKRSAVEKTVAAFSDAGFRLDRTITDHVSLLCAVLSSRNGFSGVVFSDRNDILALRISGGAIASARQFPETIAADTDALRDGIREISGTDGLVFPSQACVVFGSLPHPLTDILPHAEPFVLPVGNRRVLPSDLGGGRIGKNETTVPDPHRGRRGGGCPPGRLRLPRGCPMGRGKESLPDPCRDPEGIPGGRPGGEGERPGNGADPGEDPGALPAEQGTGIGFPGSDLHTGNGVPGPPGAQNVETYRTALVEAFGPETNVTVQEAEGSAQGGKVRYTILIEKRTNGRAS
jgi:hypothetical protein